MPTYPLLREHTGDAILSLNRIEALYSLNTRVEGPISLIDNDMSWYHSMPYDYELVRVVNSYRLTTTLCYCKRCSYIALLLLVYKTAVYQKTTYFQCIVL